ncbi:STAS domain-containing protein [Vibrio agarivorans]|uniref:STAS domain-containing protein n=1 Tax=Vibrio agarivorans TaxID=153622 RepID=A0ABT7XYP4_9VIBR|nr:STAS domain-containing protein [Vibrio agarivorans]MDN2480891.1 STAS domain-containing protein [Vibrio agarivorans]
MELQTTAINEQVLSLAIIGDFDASGSKQAQICIDSLLQGDDHQEIEIDLANVEFLDSSGIGAIVYFYKRLVESERNMRIENVHGQPLKMMELLRIGQAIPLNKNALSTEKEELTVAH